MFSCLEKRVTYFGEWAEGCRDQQTAKAAIYVLQEAVERSVDDDPHTEEVEKVLLWVAQRTMKPYPVIRFRDAMKVQDPQLRQTALQDACARILRELGLYNGSL